MPILMANIAIIENSKILLIKREDFPVWAFPGGHVEDGESLAQAAVREAVEETGIQVRIINLVGIYSLPHWRKSGYHEVLFRAIPVGGSLRLQKEEAIDARYFSDEELPDAIVWWHRRGIKEAMSNRVGVVRTQNVVWPIEEENRAEVYKLRDQGKLPLNELLAEYCGPTPQGMDIDELGH